jgi:hypothetical protein
MFWRKIIWFYLVDEMVENLDLKKFYDFTPATGNPAPEAKFIKDTSTGKIKPSYNVQVALDAQSGLMVAFQITSTPDGHEHLIPLGKKAEKDTGIKPEKVDADSGYCSNASVGALQKEHIDTCIPDTNTASCIHKGKEIKSDRSSTNHTSLSKNHEMTLLSF